MPPTKFKPVRYVSSAARRSINPPDRLEQVIGAHGQPQFVMRPVTQILFRDGVYIARNQDEVDVIEAEGDFGKTLGGKTTICRAELPKKGTSRRSKTTSPPEPEPAE